MKVILALGILLFSVISLAESPDGYAEKYMATKAKDCGDLKYGKDPEKIKKCIFEKLNNIENFYAWFWFQAGDTMPATGLLLKDGELSITWYDKVGKSKDSYFLIYTCEDWSLDITASKPIHCIMKKQKQTIHLFELSSFVELKLIP